MRTVLLIASNFVREQRWPILVLLLWVLLTCIFGLMADPRRDRDDLLVLFKQLPIYGIAFAVFIGGAAIHNERKSRRILAVLSKGVRRGEYISGILVGIVFALVLYDLCMGLTGTWVLGQGGFSIALLWFLTFSFLVACVLASAVAVLFSTFMTPLFATLATGLALGIPFVMMLQFGQNWAYLIPVYPLLENFVKATFGTPWQPDWRPFVVATVEIVAFWLLASWIFARRDIALALD